MCILKAMVIVGKQDTNYRIIRRLNSLSRLDSHCKICPNVVYLARPCQYTPHAQDPLCQAKFWSSHRYAPEVIAAVNDVLNAIKSPRPSATPLLQRGVRYSPISHPPFTKGDAYSTNQPPPFYKGGCNGQISHPPFTKGDADPPKRYQFVLIGFSGGASVATLVAGQRKDVVRLITVAGDLNHALLNQHHGTTPLRGSLNPSEDVDLVRQIPQYHWCGEKDVVVPCWTVDAFCKKVNNPTFGALQSCTQSHSPSTMGIIMADPIGDFTLITCKEEPYTSHCAQLRQQGLLRQLPNLDTIVMTFRIMIT